MTRILSPELLPKRDATKNLVPQVAVGGICSMRLSHPPTSTGILAHSWAPKTDIGFVDTIRVPVKSTVLSI